jgi:hypothetical protein
MGVRPFFNDEAHEYLDNVVCSDRDKRHMEGLVAEDDKRLARIMQEQYAGTEERITGDLDFALRICPEGEERVDEILEDLRDGTITAREAAKQLSEVKREVNRVRKLVTDLPEVEERAWTEVNKTPGQYQRQLAARAPALLKGGRGLLQLPTYDD